MSFLTLINQALLVFLRSLPVSFYEVFAIQRQKQHEMVFLYNPQRLKVNRCKDGKVHVIPVTR